MAGKLDIVIVPANQLFVFDKKLLRKTLRQAGAEVGAVAKSLIRGSTGGPGQPPANESGDLIRGIKITPSRSGDKVTVSDQARSKSGFYYAVALEGGSQGGGPPRRSGRASAKPSKMRTVTPRPFLSTALTMRAASIDQRIKATILQGVAFKRVKP